MITGKTSQQAKIDEFNGLFYKADRYILILRSKENGQRSKEESTAQI